MKNISTNPRLRIHMPFLLMSLLVWSCTDLEETIFSQSEAEDFYATEAELISAVMPVYATLRGYAWGDYMFPQEVSSDEIVVPTRGGDWDDGGIWRALQEHTWDANLGFLNGAWSTAYQGISRANITLAKLEESTSESDLIPVFISEVRFLRAFYYWWLMDLFGGVPVVTDATTDPNNPPSPSTRTEVFNFILAEINTALLGLKDASTLGAAGYGRVTKGAANAMLATLYLNAEVYTGITMWSEAVTASDAVINDGSYELIANYPDIFSLENEGPGNIENIFVIGHLAQPGVGFPRHMATLHYNQIPSNPWNGFSILADFYNAFDSDDVRLDQLLVGQQFVLGGAAAGDSAFDRSGNPLDFQVDFPLFGATESDGVRILKWPVDPNMSGGDAGNDFAVFRYAGVLLTKAEAQFMLGATGDALALVNQVRERAFDPDKPLTAITLDDILAERGFELFWENFRRQDQIRHGKFLDAWTLKITSDGSHRLIYPIPQSQLDANPNLVQNIGY
ncbi:MAG: RagB/SusD family nutrient uptake outer membrane protein [Candidatus Marinimicrobia bacterium]|nr:RagB/SusD family nutrient uptake outer membrane protein [Candidatus Neomarinimicrobiota bacterium]